MNLVRFRSFANFQFQTLYTSEQQPFDHISDSIQNLSCADRINLFIWNIFMQIRILDGFGLSWLNECKQFTFPMIAQNQRFKLPIIIHVYGEKKV